jgi:hypothetical protein
LAERANKTPTVKADELQKFAAYLLNRKSSVRQPRQTHQLVLALSTLANNNFMMPVSVTRDTGVAVTRGSVTRVRVCDVMGQPLTGGAPAVIADSAVLVDTQATVLNKVPMAHAHGGDGSVFMR